MTLLGGTDPISVRVTEVCAFAASEADHRKCGRRSPESVDPLIKCACACHDFSNRLDAKK